MIEEKEINLSVSFREKEINLSSIIRVMWERGKRILLFTLLCTALAAIVSLLIHNRYESAAVLFMNKSKLGERTMQYPSVPMRTYEKLFMQDEVILDVMKKYALDQSPYSFKYADDLRDRIMVYYLIDTSLINIAVVLEDPQTAADVANELASRAIAKVDNLLRIEQNTSTHEIETQSDKIYNEAIGFKNTHLETQKRNLLPMQIQTLSNYMTLYANAMQQRDTLDHSIVEQERRKVGFEEILSATSDYKQKVELRRALITDPLLIQQYREQHGGEIRLDDLKDIVFVEEQMDVYYNQFMMEYKKLLIDLPSLIPKRDSLLKSEQDYKKKIEDLQTKMFDMEMEELVTKGDFDRALEVYSGINKQVGWAGTTVATERQDLVQVSHAVPNLKKVSPRRSLMVAVSGMSSFLLAFLYYLLVDLYGLVRSNTGREDSISAATKV